MILEPIPIADINSLTHVRVHAGSKYPWVVKPEKKNYIITITPLPLLAQEQTYAELIPTTN
jgi:hypothetical protein